MKTRFLLALFCSAFLLSSCGYHLGEIRPTAMRSVKNLAIPTFKNRTYDPRIDVLMTDILIREFQTDGTFQIVGTERADAILYCTLNNSERRSIRSVVTNVLASSEYELVLTVAFEVQDRVTGAILMSGEVRGRSSFFPTGDLQTDERQAFSGAAQRVAVEISTRVNEGW